MNIGIIGNGFVGTAVNNAFSLKGNKTFVYDSDRTRCKNSLEQTALESRFLFVCVPTPYDFESACFDSSIIDLVCNQLSELRTDAYIIIKSTVIPGTCEKLSQMYPHLRLIFAPEFLTERTANEDFLNPSRIILGFNKNVDYFQPVISFFRENFSHVPIITTDYITSEFIKYFCNCFYATKVSIMNEFYQLAIALGVQWETALQGLLSSGWVNKMHTQVPGPDGDFGFGGKCFPKDLKSFIKLFKDQNIDPVLLSAVWEKNSQIRTQKDWCKAE